MSDESEFFSVNVPAFLNIFVSFDRFGISAEEDHLVKLRSPHNEFYKPFQNSEHAEVKA